MAMSAQKRKAADDLQNEQRLTKRFDLLNLDHNGKLYVPVQHHPANGQLPQGRENHGSMQVDDTKDRVYIHNLEDELSDIEADEDRLVFLPDIEKRLGKIPKSVLLSERHPSIGSEVVLYGVPTSLSIPKEHDNVRKAIIESRARAREKQVADGAKLEIIDDTRCVAADLPSSAGAQEEDAMDIE